jgi:hypothetical protein
MLAGVPVLAGAVAELADTVRADGADGLADRLEVALDDDVKLLALTIDERAIILAALEDPPRARRASRRPTQRAPVAARSLNTDRLVFTITVCSAAPQRSLFCFSRSSSGC